MTMMMMMRTALGLVLFCVSLAMAWELQLTAAGDELSTCLATLYSPGNVSIRLILDRRDEWSWIGARWEDVREWPYTPSGVDKFCNANCTGVREDSLFLPPLAQYLFSCAIDPPTGKCMAYRRLAGVKSSANPSGYFWRNTPAKGCHTEGAQTRIPVLVGPGHPPEGIDAVIVGGQMDYVCGPGTHISTDRAGIFLFSRGEPCPSYRRGETECLLDELYQDSGSIMGGQRCMWGSSGDSDAACLLAREIGHWDTEHDCACTETIERELSTFKCSASGGVYNQTFPSIHCHCTAVSPSPAEVPEKEGEAVLPTPFDTSTPIPAPESPSPSSSPESTTPAVPTPTPEIIPFPTISPVATTPSPTPTNVNMTSTSAAAAASSDSISPTGESDGGLSGIGAAATGVAGVSVTGVGAAFVFVWLRRRRKVLYRGDERVPKGDDTKDHTSDNEGDEHHEETATERGRHTLPSSLRTQIQRAGHLSDNSNHVSDSDVDARYDERLQQAEIEEEAAILAVLGIYDDDDLDALQGDNARALEEKKNA